MAQIAANSGQQGDWVTRKVLESEDQDFGFDAKSGKFVSLRKAGIIDPTKVVRTALENAVSISSLLLSCGCAITLKPKKITLEAKSASQLTQIALNK